MLTSVSMSLERTNRATTPTIQRLVATTVALALPMLFGACSTPNSIDASDFDQSCTKASDCVAVISGKLECCDTRCQDNAAINQKVYAAYEAEQEARTPKCNVACLTTDCIPRPLACVGGTCTLESATP